MKCALRSQKPPPCDPPNPNSFGSCVLARKSATPHLNPTITDSEMKVTTAPALQSHAAKAMAATRSAVQAASARKRLASPPAMLPSDAPSSSEIAEVTVITVCRELQRSQKTRPEKRHA